MNVWIVLWNLVRKDMLAEFRARQVLVASTAFGVLVLFIAGMALNGSARPEPDIAAGLLWMCAFFTTAVGMNRFDIKDREMEARLGLLLAPFDRSLLYYAKWISTSVFVLIANAALVVAFFIILNEPLPTHPVLFIIACCIGSVGITGVGVFLTSLAGASTMRDVLVPILMFPLSIPLFLALIRLTTNSFLESAPFDRVWMEVLIGYLIAFAVLPWLLYEPLMEV